MIRMLYFISIMSFYYNYWGLLLILLCYFILIMSFIYLLENF